MGKDFLFKSILAGCALFKVGDQNLQLPGMEVIHPTATISYILLYALDLKIHFSKVNHHAFEILSNLHIKLQNLESLDYKNIISILYFSTFIVH